MKPDTKRTDLGLSSWTTMVIAITRTTGNVVHESEREAITWWSAESGVTIDPGVTVAGLRSLGLNAGGVRSPTGQLTPTIAV